MESQALTADYLQAQEAVVIVTDHSAVDWNFVVRHARLIIDPRNATSKVSGSRSHVTN
jgi:UDP-N-acetyl-D-glucosamine dehydrogenase